MPCLFPCTLATTAAAGAGASADDTRGGHAMSNLIIMISVFDFTLLLQLHQLSIHLDGERQTHGAEQETIRSLLPFK